MKVLFVVLLLAFLGIELCLSKTCSKFRVSFHRHYGKEWIYHIGLLSKDNDTFTVKLGYMTFPNDATLWTRHAYLVHQNDDEYTFKLNPKGKQELQKVRTSVPCRYGVIHMHLYSYITKQRRPEISELHVGDFDCTVRSAQCPQFGSCRKYYLNVRRRSNGERYAESYFSIQEPMLRSNMRSNITVAFDRPVKSLKVDGVQYVSSDCSQIYHFERKTSWRRRNLRLPYTLELHRNGSIPSIAYISVGNNVCNSTCGERVVCSTASQFNGTHTTLQDLDMTSLLDVTSASHGIYKRSPRRYSRRYSRRHRTPWRIRRLRQRMFWMIKRLRNQLRAVLRMMNRLGRRSHIVHHRIFRRLRVLRYQWRTLLRMINKLREEAQSTKSPRPISKATASPPRRPISEITASPPRRPISEMTASPPSRPISGMTASPPRRPISEMTASPPPRPISEMTASPPRRPISEMTASPPRRPTSEMTASPERRQTPEMTASPPRRPTSEMTTSSPRRPTSDMTASPPRRTYSTTTPSPGIQKGNGTNSPGIEEENRDGLLFELDEMSKEVERDWHSEDEVDLNIEDNKWNDEDLW